MLVIFSLFAFLFFMPLAFIIRVIGPHPTKSCPRVFIGFNEIAYLVHSISDCLALAGYPCTAFIIENKLYPQKRPEHFPGLRTVYFSAEKFKDSIRNSFYLIVFFLPLLYRHDVFIMVWEKSFLPFSLDAILIRLAGKRLIFMNCGDDVRFRPLQRKIDAVFGPYRCPDEKWNGARFLKKIYRQTFCEIFGVVISMRDQATFQKKSLYFFRFPQCELLPKAKKASNVPLIVHCPSDPRFKRTDVVLAAIEILQAEGLAFEFELIQNKTNDQVLEKLRAADIVIDQPWIWVARLAVEALAMGCCVVGGNRPSYTNRTDSPVIQFEPYAKDLANTLRVLILDKNLRQEKMVACYNFWKDHYSYSAYILFFEQLLQGRADQFFAAPDHKKILKENTHCLFERGLISLSYWARK